MRDVVVCVSCLTEPADRGSWCDECYSTCIRRDRKAERVRSILEVPVTAEAPNGIYSV